MYRSYPLANAFQSFPAAPESCMDCGRPAVDCKCQDENGAGVSRSSTGSMPVPYDDTGMMRTHGVQAVSRSSRHGIGPANPRHPAPDRSGHFGGTNAAGFASVYRHMPLRPR